jgi:hypothetical protein
VAAEQQQPDGRDEAAGPLNLPPHLHRHPIGIVAACAWVALCLRVLSPWPFVAGSCHLAQQWALQRCLERDVASGTATQQNPV